MRAEPANVELTPRHPGMALWLLLTVSGVIGLQWLGGKPEHRKKPGPQRGDVAVKRECLPVVLAERQQVGFKPPASPELIPDGIYWWVHQWFYQHNGVTAVVSFDQLGEDQRHELTYCYRNQNRTIEQRDVYQDPEDGGQYVVATLSDSQQQLAVLVFSVFFEDGQWAQPPIVKISNLNVKPRNPEIADLLAERVDPTISFENPSGVHDRALQCQVLVPCSDTNLVTTVDRAIALHLETRRHLRRRWLTHAMTASN